MVKKLVVLALVFVLVAGFAGVVAAEGVKVYQGLGKDVNFRVGPGRDSEEVPVYSINYVYATVLFDADGRIIDSTVDILELSTPNYDGASMPHFSGWPGKEGYNVTDHESGKVVGVSDNTPEFIAAEVNAWQSKRERGDDYGMNPWNEWDKQMDFFEENFFKGRTVAEIEELFARTFSDRNGRPLNPATTNAQDKAKLETLSAEDKAMLADVITGATMSINDSHGNIIAALRDAYENRTEVVIPVK